MRAEKFKRTENLARLILTICIVGFALPPSAAQAVLQGQEMLLVARASEKQGDLKRALLAYRKLSSNEEFKEQGMLGVARILMIRREYDDAFNLVSELLNDINPFQIEARLIRAELYSMRGEHATALEEAERVLRLRAGHPAATDRKSAELIALKKFDEASRVLNEAGKSGRMEVALLIKRARARIETGELQGAIQDLNQVIEERPASIEAYELSAEAYTRSKSWKNAETAYRSLLRLTPDSSAAWEGLGDSLNEQGGFQAAKEAFLQAIQFEPSRNSAGLKVAKYYIQTGNPVAAEDELKRELRQDPSYEPTAMELSQLYMRDGRLDQAGSLLKQQAENFPERSWAMQSYAKILISLGMLEEAERAIGKVKSQDMNWTKGAYSLQAMIQSKREKHQEASKILAEAESKYPDDTLIRFNHAVVLEAIGDHNGASSKYRTLLSDKKVGYKASINLALLMEKTGNITESLQILRTAAVPTELRVAVARKIIKLNGTPDQPPQRAIATEKTDGDASKKGESLP